MFESLTGIVFSILILLLDIWAIYSVLRSSKPTGVKAVWTILILVLPLVGLIIWGVAGPRGVARPPHGDTNSQG